MVRKAEQCLCFILGGLFARVGKRDAGREIEGEKEGCGTEIEGEKCRIATGGGVGY